LEKENQPNNPNPVQQPWPNSAPQAVRPTLPPAQFGPLPPAQPVRPSRSARDACRSPACTAASRSPLLPPSAWTPTPLGPPGSRSEPPPAQRTGLRPLSPCTPGPSVGAAQLAPRATPLTSGARLSAPSSPPFLLQRANGQRFPRRRSRRPSPGRPPPPGSPPAPI
jgi:hypothetical protein